MREKLLFDENWMFHKGDIEIPLPKDKGPIYMQSKTERMLWGPAARKYTGYPDDFNTDGDHEIQSHKWEWVTLPHDYIILQKPSQNENSALGFFKYENAWYRKKFCLPKTDAGRRITLLFEGVATQATVYLNGCLMKRNSCGYTSFEVDISDVVKFGDGEDNENVLAVYVETGNHEGWWYEGGGIYRHVWLNKMNPVAVDLWGVYAMPRLAEDGQWDVNVETTIINDRYEDIAVKAVTTFYDQNRKSIAKGEGLLKIPLREKGLAKYSMRIENPILWDLENPYLYTIETKVFVKGKECDCYETHTGFRDFVLDADEGLFLNGKHIKIKGVCAHQDCGLTGKAVSDNIHRYKIEMIKEMGANGYRTSHYPQTAAIMDTMDELGFIVMAETRWFESTDEGKQQLEMLVKRDRNRPSILFWSIGNEEPNHTTDVGRRICKNLMALVRKLDDTRYIVAAVSNDPDIATVYDELDAIGINYNLDKYDKIHMKYPSKPIFSSECCATGTTRGWYEDDCTERAFLSAYDKDTTNWFLGREKTWKFMCEHKWVLGGYQWIAFEHRGESVWPRLCSQAGAIDLFLQKKDAFYQNQSHWLDSCRPMVHLLPHWNFQGREGEKIRVVAYTNCEELELYLNNKSIGKQRIERYGHGEWLVEYEAGELRCEARINGKTVCEDMCETTDKAEKLNLRMENDVKANGNDIAIITCYCTDSAGREVPNATPYVSFFTNKFGKVIATGSDITDHNPVMLPDRKMRAGKITVAVQVGKEKGELKVYAVADGLQDAVLTILLNK